MYRLIINIYINFIDKANIIAVIPAKAGVVVHGGTDYGPKDGIHVWAFVGLVNPGAALK